MIKRELYMNRIRPFIGGELIKSVSSRRDFISSCESSISSRSISQAV